MAFWWNMDRDKSGDERQKYGNKRKAQKTLINFSYRFMASIESDEDVNKRLPKVKWNGLDSNWLNYWFWWLKTRTYPKIDDKFQASSL